MLTEALIMDRLQGLAEAFNRHDVDGVLSFFAADCVMEMPRGNHAFGERFVGKLAVRRGVIERFEGLPDVRYADVHHYVAGHLGISRWTVSGTPAAGSTISANGCDFYFFSADLLVTKKDSYWKHSEAPPIPRTVANR